MTRGEGIDRRRFLQATFGIGTALALAKVAPWRALVEIVDQPVATRLASLLEHRRSAAVVGAEYLRGRRAGIDARRIAAAILRDLPENSARAAPASSGELKELVAARVQRDFEERNTVELRGWITSRTEARLCALVALEDERRRLDRPSA